MSSEAKKQPSEYDIIYEEVEEMLKEFSVTRNSDDDLFYYVITRKHGVQISYEDFHRIFAVKFTTVERIRRKIQAEGRYPPTDPRVAVQRANRTAWNDIDSGQPRPLNHDHRANRQEAMRILYSPKEEATKVEGRVNQRTVEEYYDEQ